MGGGGYLKNRNEAPEDIVVKSRSTTRRQFLFTASAAAFSTQVSFAKRPHGKPRRIVFGTGGRVSKGIYAADWNPSTGEVGEISLVAEVAAPTFLAIHPHGSEHFIYAVSEAGRSDSVLTAWTTVPGQKEFKKLDEVASMGGGPTHLSVSPHGTSVACANYGGGSVSSYHVLPDGSLSQCVSHFQFTGSGPYKGRQERPHTHSANITPDGKWVLVNDLGIDRIFIYHLNEATGEMTPGNPPFWAAKPGSGPRHLAFHPNGKWVYSVNELTSTVDMLHWDKKHGTLTPFGSVSTLKEGFPPDTAFAGEILCSRDGRNVYVGNRVADDTIAVFDVNHHSGVLTLTQLAENSGKNPRHVALDPSGRWIVICDQGSSSIVVLERDRKTGHLSATKHTYSLDTPQFAGFI
jgi:6-phosphogluconolactonase (cycloisomerase 2 family)